MEQGMGRRGGGGEVRMALKRRRVRGFGACAREAGVAASCNSVEGLAQAYARGS
jgi:hypothetical protein